MESAKKERARRVALTILADLDLYDRLDRHRKASGVPLTIFGARALDAALEAAGFPRIVKSKPCRKPARSA